MRILTVVAGMGVGGTERAAQNLTLGLKRLGAEVAVLAHAERGPREAAYHAAGIAVFGPGEAAAAAGWGADVVHIHRTGYANARETDLMRLLKRPGAKVVETNVFARFDAGEGGRLIDVHCPLSRWCAWKWSAWGGAAARAKPMRVLPNAVDAGGIGRVPDAVRAEVRARLGVPPGRFLFGRIGQPHPAKWSPRIFAAFAAVLARGHDVGLLAGRGARGGGRRRGAAAGGGAGAGGVAAGDRLGPADLGVADGDGRVPAPVADRRELRDGALRGDALRGAGGHAEHALQGQQPARGGGARDRRAGGADARGGAGGDAGADRRRGPQGAGACGRGGLGRGAVRGRRVAGEAMAIYEGCWRGGRSRGSVPDRGWIEAVAGRGFGRRPGMADALALRLLHAPPVYRSYLALARGGVA